MLGTVAGARGELLPLLDPAPLPEPDERGTRGDAAALEDDAAEAEDSLAGAAPRGGNIVMAWSVVSKHSTKPRPVSEMERSALQLRDSTCEPPLRGAEGLHPRLPVASSCVLSEVIGQNT